MVSQPFPASTAEIPLRGHALAGGREDDAIAGSPLNSPRHLRRPFSAATEGGRSLFAHVSSMPPCSRSAAKCRNESHGRRRRKPADLTRACSSARSCASTHSGFCLRSTRTRSSPSRPGRRRRPPSPRRQPDPQPQPELDRERPRLVLVEPEPARPRLPVAVARVRDRGARSRRRPGAPGLTAAITILAFLLAR